MAEQDGTAIPPIMQVLRRGKRNRSGAAIKTEEFIDYLKAHTNIETGEYFGIGTRTVQRIRNDLGLSYRAIAHPEFPANLSRLQRDITVASMLGDGTVTKHGVFRIKMSIASQEYLEYLTKIFAPLSRPLYYCRTMKPVRVNGKVIHGVSGEYSSSCAFRAYIHDNFKVLRAAWYIDRRKQIPADLKLSARIIAHWFVQDGHNHVTRSSCSISTCSFSREEVERLRVLIRDAIGIETTMQHNGGRPIIAIGKYERKRFLPIIARYLPFRCFRYKLSLKKTERPAVQHLLF